ncbi:flagellin N-terminal helical domain-containing protein [Microvirga roseola]|uniref:flagellin N-terminal helical domain-containing protein n=1 Tax=Microvirga roseola TaxID=2883126 RepID=UPI001E39ADB2|nr:flagellin [Microvirga roseola]
MASINTNLSAQTALQALKTTQNSLTKTQGQISTGLRVSEASHNASYWSISTKMKSDNGALGAVKDSISQSKAMINTFTSAMDKTLTYLNKMKDGLVAAAQPGADLEKIQTEFDTNIAGMKSAAASASFNGQNWLSGDGDLVKLVTSYDGNTKSVGTLAVDTSKTTLFKDAISGTGGILGDVAKTDISGNAAYVDIKFPETGSTSGISRGDALAITVGGSALATLVVDSTNINTIDELADRINGDSRLNGSVVASKTDDGKLRLTAKDVTKDIQATYDDNTAAGTAPTIDATRTATLETGNGTTQGGKATFTDLVAGDLSTTGQLRFTLTDGTEMVFTASSAASLADLAKAVNDNKEFSALVTASVNADGDFVLQAKDPSKNIESAQYLDISAAEAAGTTNEASQPTSESFASTIATKLSAALKEVDEAINKVTEGSAMLGANKALLETQEEFIGVLSDSLTAGVSAFIDADMNEASTRLQALQTQQQLGVQALSIANQNSQMILRLFQ